MATRKPSPKQNSKTSLQKSHSAWSNTKLTLLCILASFAFAGIWITLALKNFFIVRNLDALFIILLVATSVVTFLCLIMFNKFKR